MDNKKSNGEDLITYTWAPRTAIHDTVSYEKLCLSFLLNLTIQFILPISTFFKNIISFININVLGK